jgi:uncharacterized protein
LKNGIYINIKYVNDLIYFFQRPSPRLLTCGVAISYVGIDVNGDIWPCSRWTRQEDKSWLLGNIYKNFNDLKRHTVSIPNENFFSEMHCDNCIARSICAGGCTEENFLTTGHFHKPHTNMCHLSQSIASAVKTIHDKLYEEKSEQFMKKYYPSLDKINCEY